MLSLLESNLRVIEYIPLLLTIAVFFLTTCGWYFGRYRLMRQGESIIVRDSLVAAIFGLSALVLGFTFSGSASRYADRMDSIRNQAQSLQEVYTSLKYLAPKDQVEIKQSLDDLLNLRLTVFKDIHSRSDVDSGASKIMAATRKIQEEARGALANAPVQNKILVSDLFMPQVQNMSSAFSAGAVNVKAHPPGLLLRFLFALLCIGAFLIGYTMAVKKESDWLLASLYTILIGLSLYVILSLEVPNILMPYEEVNRDFLLLRESIK